MWKAIKNNYSVNIGDYRLPERLFGYKMFKYFNELYNERRKEIDPEAP